MAKPTYRFVLTLSLALGLLVLAFAPAGATTELSGKTKAGALYQIAVPDGWQPGDGLVIWNHGYNGFPLDVALWLGSLADHQLADGYAVAATSYRDTEWAVFHVVQDVRELVKIFKKKVGVPGHIFLSGLSMGGLVSVRMIEEGGLKNVAGALTWCGAVGPTTRTWDLFLDVRLLYDVVCGDVPGAAIPGGAGGLPWPPDPAFDPKWEDYLNPVPEPSNPLLYALDNCTGIATPASERSPEQQARLERLTALAGIEKEFIVPDMFLGSLGIWDLIHDPMKLHGGMPFDNFDVDYGDPVVNATIERVRADPEARRDLSDNYTPSGKVGDVKIIALHTDKDGIVPVEQLADYAAIVPPDNLTGAVAIEDVPTHCGHTEAELLGSWNALKDWAAGAPQPSAATIQANCEAAVAAGDAEGPCRFDPDFVIGSLDDRLPPRAVCQADGETLCLRDGRFQVTMSWEDAEGHHSMAGTAPQTDASGSFYFLDPENLELTVKVLDGRQVNGHFWIYGGALTDAGFQIVVTDTVTLLQWVYENRAGRLRSVGDTWAF